MVTLSAPNTAAVNGVISVFASVPTDSQFISGLGNFSGTFTIQAGDLFGFTSINPNTAISLPAVDTPLINASTVELASFARLTPAAIVGMAQNSSYLAGEIDAQRLIADLPFLNLTQGDAYDFATALQNAFVNAMQKTEIVLTAINEPATDTTNMPSGDPTDLTGQTSFKVELNIGTAAYVLNVSLAKDTGRTGATAMTTLASDLTAAFATALTGAGLSPTEIQARLITNSAGTQILQLYSADPTAEYFLYNFAAPANGVIDLGFNQYNNVVAQASTDITGTNFQIPGVIVQSGSAISLGNFATATSFKVNVNGTTTTVTIPADAYTSETTLVAAVQNALVSAGVWDGVSQNGVLVQGVTVGSGFGLEFYGGNDVNSLTISTPGGGSNFSALNITSGAFSNAPSFNLTLTINGTAQAPVTVFVNGNLTNGLLNLQQANKSATDLASDIEQAIAQAGIVDSSGNPLITVSSETDSSGNPVLEFFAASPGTGTGQISSFTIKNISSAFSGLIGTTNISSQNIALATSSTTPAFQTIQQLAALLYNLNLTGGTGVVTNSDSYFGILAAAPSYSAAQLNSPTGTPTFTFPIDISVNDTSTLGGSKVLPDLTGVGLSFATTYDDVSGLSSSSTVSIARTDNLSFDFGINLIAPVNASESLTATLPVSQLFTDYFLNGQGIIQFTPATGVTYTATLNPNAAGDSTSLTSFLAALNAAIGSATSSVSGAPALTTYLVNSGVTLAGTGSLVIGGHTISAGDIGDYVLLSDQTDPTQDGTYLVTAVTTTSGGSWTLTSTNGDPGISYTATAPITVGTATTSTTNPQYVGVNTDPNTGEVSLVFNTVGGSTRELTITVPADSATASSVYDAAWYDLGFLPNTTQTTPYKYTSSSSTNNNAITATSTVGLSADNNGTFATATPTLFSTADSSPLICPTAPRACSKSTRLTPQATRRSLRWSRRSTTTSSPPPPSRGPRGRRWPTTPPTPASMPSMCCRRSLPPPSAARSFSVSIPTFIRTTPPPPGASRFARPTFRTIRTASSRTSGFPRRSWSIRPSQPPACSAAPSPPPSPP